MEIDQKFYFDRTAAVYQFFCKQNKHDIYLFFHYMRNEIRSALRRFIQASGPIRWSFNVKIKFQRKRFENMNNGESDYDQTIETIIAYFRSITYTSLRKNGINMMLDHGFSKIIRAMEEFVKQGSGWTFMKCKQLELKIVLYEPMAAAKFIPLQSKLISKRAVLNIRNNDNRCFVYCVLAALHPFDRQKNANRINKFLPFEKELNLKGIVFPMNISQIPKFERQNPTISINVFQLTDGGQIIPSYISPEFHRQHNLDLLLLKSSTN